MQILIDERFYVHIGRLKAGQTEKIEESVSVELFEFPECEMQFLDPVHLCGEAYVADDELVIRLDLEVRVRIPCRICNDPVEVATKVKDFYHVQPLGEIKDDHFMIRDLVRDTLLLETVELVECEGKCPRSEEFKKYIKESDEVLDETYRPFTDL